MKKTIKMICLLSIVTIATHAQNITSTNEKLKVEISDSRIRTHLLFAKAKSIISNVKTDLPAQTVLNSATSTLRTVSNTAFALDNIYNNDGTLADTRVVTMEGHDLTFNPSNSNSEIFFNGKTGDVGLGTTTPRSRLDVRGFVYGIGGSFLSGLEDGVEFNEDAFNTNIDVLSAGAYVNKGKRDKTFNFYDFPKNDKFENSFFWFNLQNRNDIARFEVAGELNAGSHFALMNNRQEAMFRVDENGFESAVAVMPKADSYLGIGTSNFTDGTETYRLSVKGKIRAEEVRVYTTWADYVFKNDYKLTPLTDVEKYIKTNGHLSNVPSAAVIEIKGLQLGEMVKIQQEKIEELTLYIIQMNKDIEALKIQLKK